MFKFVFGTIVGAFLAFGYVRFDLSLPAPFQLPDRLRGNLIATATESDLFNLQS